MGGFYCRQQTFCTDWRGDQGTQAALAALATAWLALVVGLFGFMSHTPFVVMFIVFPGALAWLHQANGRTADVNTHRLNIGALLLATALFYVAAVEMDSRSFGFAQCEYDPKGTQRTHPAGGGAAQFMDSAAALQRLLKPLLPVLESGVFGDWALTGGSLLGVERSRTLNPYEVDVDVLLQHPSRALELANQEVLRQRGLFAFRWCGVEWWRCDAVRVCRRSTQPGPGRWLGVKTPHAGRYLPYVDLYPAERRPLNSSGCVTHVQLLQLPLRTVELKSGMRVQAPSVELSHRFLRCVYGNWRAPPDDDDL